MTFKNSLSRLFKLLTPQGTITEQVVKSGIWATALNGCDRLLQLVKLVVLAHFLPPSAFGLMGIALLAIAVFRQFSELGLDPALIQRREEDIDPFLNTAWSLKVLRGIGIASIAFLLAPMVARFFGEPQAIPVIKVVALVPLLDSFHNPGVVYLRKNLDFDKQFTFVLAGTLVNVIVAIIAAVLLKNVWALVYGSVAGSVISLGVSYYIHEFRPKPEIKREIATDLLGYGKWIFGSGILMFLFTQGDDAFVGWFLSASALGLYQVAYRFSNAPATEITQVVSGVVFPAFSKLQHDIDKLRQGYLRSLKLTLLIAAPLSIGLAVIAPTFVKGFFGSNWLPMVPVIQILAILGGFRAFGATTGPLFKAIGRPDVLTKLQVGNVLIMAIIIYPATNQWGIAGTAIAVLSTGLMIPAITYLLIHELETSINRFMYTITYPILAALLMGISVWYLQTQLPIQPAFLKFTILTITGIIIYLFIIVLIDTYTNYGVKDLLGEVFGAI